MEHLLCAKPCTAKHDIVETAYWILQSERPWFKSWLHHRPAAWPWILLHYWWLHFLISERGTMLPRIRGNETYLLAPMMLAPGSLLPPGHCCLESAPHPSAHPYMLAFHTVLPSSLALSNLIHFPSHSYPLCYWRHNFSPPSLDFSPAAHWTPPLGFSQNLKLSTSQAELTIFPNKTLSPLCCPSLRMVSPTSHSPRWETSQSS